MKYLMLVCFDPTRKVQPGEGGDVEPWVEEYDASGVRLEGERLRPVSDATTVAEAGKLITDGPFAETKDLIAGYDLLDCASMEQAVEVAAKHPMASVGSIEVRQLWED